MIDCYRHVYPEHCDYTWCNIRSQARIDRIYVPRYLKSHIVSCYSTVCPLSDHRSIKVILCKPFKKSRLLNWKITFFNEEFYSDKNSTKKYSVGIIDMIKLRNIYNTYTYIPIYIRRNTYTYM